jgi:hypothetical protein
VTVAELLVLALRVLPGEIRERLNAERSLRGQRRDSSGERTPVRAHTCSSVCGENVREDGEERR